MTEETVIYEFSGVTLNEEKLYKRVVLEKTITISEKQFDEAFMKASDSIVRGCKGLISDLIKMELGF